jgi:hypothetical protein
MRGRPFHWEHVVPIIVGAAAGAFWNIKRPTRSSYSTNLPRLPSLPGMTLALDDRGIIQSVGQSRTTMPWSAIASVTVETSLIRFVSTEKLMVALAPRSAFPNEDEMQYFVAVANACIEANRSGEPVKLPPKPSVWPPAPGSGQ